MTLNASAKLDEVSCPISDTLQQTFSNLQILKEEKCFVHWLHSTFFLEVKICCIVFFGFKYISVCYKYWKVTTAFLKKDKYPQFREHRILTISGSSQSPRKKINFQSSLDAIALLPHLRAKQIMCSHWTQTNSIKNKSPK